MISCWCNQLADAHYNEAMSTPRETSRGPAGVPEPGGLIPQQPVSIITYPLQASDPARIGQFWPDARLVATASGVAYLAHAKDSPDPVMVIMLSQGAAGDMAARDRLAGQVDRMDIDTVIASSGLGHDIDRTGSTGSPESPDSTASPDSPEGSTDSAAPSDSPADPPSTSPPEVISPWVALAFDQTPRAVNEARRVLAEVDLSQLPQQGQPSGPDYRLHWTDRFMPGLARVWPLPWPGRRERGGWLTILASWLLMLLLAAIAVLIAILIFSRAPQTSPPPPIPPTEQPTSTQSNTASPPPQTSSPSPDTASPSPDTASPSPDTASPSPSSGSASPSSGSPSASGSASPTPSPSASPSGGSGSPTPVTASPSPGGTDTATVSVGSPTPPSRL